MGRPGNTSHVRAGALGGSPAISQARRRAKARPTPATALHSSVGPGLAGPDRVRLKERTGKNSVNLAGSHLQVKCYAPQTPAWGKCPLKRTGQRQGDAT